MATKSSKVSKSSLPKVSNVNQKFTPLPKKKIEDIVIPSILITDNGKYFGENAKQDFFSRQNWLKKLQDIECKSEEQIKGTRFDKRQQSPTTSAGSLSDNHFQDFVQEVNEENLINNSDTIPILKHDSDDFVEELWAISPRSQYILDCIADDLRPRPALILRKNDLSGLDLKHVGMGDKYGIHFGTALRGLPNITKIDLSDNNLTDKSLYSIVNAIIDTGCVTYLNLSQNKVDLRTAQALSIFLSDDRCYLETLVLRNINLDDNECCVLVDRLKSNHRLKHLDVSSNSVGKNENMPTISGSMKSGSLAFGNLLASSTCSLNTLQLSWNMIRRVIWCNTLYYTVYHIRTSIYGILLSSCIARLKGACALSQSLSTNMFLTDLDLSYNSLHRDGGETLGKALLTNNTIKTLNLMRNNLVSSAAFTLCVGIEHCQSLEYVNMSENPIGIGGIRVLMPLTVTHGHRVRVEGMRCNIKIKDPSDGSIDMLNPVGQYVLDCSLPYDRAIIIKLLDIAAEHSHYEVSKYEYFPQVCEVTGRHGVGASLPSGISTTIPLHSCRVTNTRMSSTQNKFLSCLKQFVSILQNSSLIDELFLCYDVDHSGILQRDEFKNLFIHLSSIHMNYDIDYVSNKLCKLDESTIKSLIDKKKSALKVRSSLSTKEIEISSSQDETMIQDIIMSQFDITDKDRSGGIDNLEFKSFLGLIEHSMQSYILQLQTLCYLSQTKQSDTSDLNPSRYPKFIPHNKGLVCLTIGVLPEQKSIFRMLNSLDLRMMYESLDPSAESVVDRLTFAICNFKIQIGEALTLYRTMFPEVFNLSKVLSILLPLINDLDERKWLVANKVGSNDSELLRLKNVLGSAFNPLLGIFTGYYNLNFKNANDRLCISLLVAHNNACKRERVRINYNRMKNTNHNAICGDISQHGNWSCFRNEIVTEAFPGADITLSKPPTSFDTRTHTTGLLDSSSFAALPTRGKCSFDFVGYDRRNHNEQAMKDIECINVLKNLGMLQAPDRKISRRGSLIGLNGVDLENAVENGVDDNIQLSTAFVFLKELATQVQTSFENHSRVRDVIELVNDEDGEKKRFYFLVGYFTNLFYSRLQGREEENIKAEVRESRVQTANYLQDVIDENYLQNVPELSFKDLLIHEDHENSENSDEFLYKLTPVDSLIRLSENDSLINNHQESSTPDLLMRERKRNAICPELFSRVGSRSIDHRVALKFTTSIDAVNVKRLSNRIELHFGKYWILSRHLALIIKQFTTGIRFKTIHFGTYRVELFVSLFDRVIDKFNLYQAMELFTPFELAAVYGRLGHLTLFNPLRPSGFYRLNLGVREEREVAKMLKVLEKVDAGYPLAMQLRRHKYCDLDLPYVNFPDNWYNEKEFPDSGIMFMSYPIVSHPNYGARRALLCSSNVVEEDILDIIQKNVKDIGIDWIHEIFADSALAFHDVRFLTYWKDLLALDDSKSSLAAADIYRRFISGKGIG